jgi:hypothetical protein
MGNSTSPPHRHCGKYHEIKKQDLPAAANKRLAAAGISYFWCDRIIF